MNKTQILTLAVSALAGVSFAGEAAKSSSKNPAPVAIEPAASPFSGSLSAGYDSKYVYRGVEVGDHQIWTALDLNYAISDKINWNFNAWYGNTQDPNPAAGYTNDNYGELDLYTEFAFNLGPVTVAPSFKYYRYFDVPAGLVDEQEEVGLNVRSTLFKNDAISLDASLGAFYEFELDGFYYEAGLAATIKVNDMISLVPGVTIGYSDELVNTATSDWNQVGVYLKVPIALSKTVTLTPYIAGNFPLDGISDFTDNALYGGASLTVKF